MIPTGSLLKLYNPFAVNNTVYNVFSIQIDFLKSMNIKNLFGILFSQNDCYIV